MVQAVMQIVEQIHINSVIIQKNSVSVLLNREDTSKTWQRHTNLLWTT